MEVVEFCINIHIKWMKSTKKYFQITFLIECFNLINTNIPEKGNSFMSLKPWLGKNYTFLLSSSFIFRSSFLQFIPPFQRYFRVVGMLIYNKHSLFTLSSVVLHSFVSKVMWVLCFMIRFMWIVIITWLTKDKPPQQ